MVPDEVALRLLVAGMTPLAAWRNHLGLTQEEMAARLDMSPASYARQEVERDLHQESREQLAPALVVSAVQLDLR